MLTWVLTPPDAGAGAALPAGAAQPPAALRQPLSSAEVSRCEPEVTRSPLMVSVQPRGDRSLPQQPRAARGGPRLQPPPARPRTLRLPAAAAAVPAVLGGVEPRGAAAGRGAVGLAPLPGPRPGLARLRLRGCLDAGAAAARGAVLRPAQPQVSAEVAVTLSP